MAPCPICGKELEYVSQYSQWYCQACQRYPFWPSPPVYPPYGYPYPPPQSARGEEKSVVMIIAIVVILVVVIPMIFGFIYVYLITSEIDNLMDDVTTSEFPTVEIELKKDSNEYIYLIITHESGEPIDWMDYLITINDKTSSTNTVTLSGLTGEQSYGQIITFTNNTEYPGGVITSELSLLDVEIDNWYFIRIYNIQEDMQVLTKELMCTAFPE